MLGKPIGHKVEIPCAITREVDEAASELAEDFDDRPD